MTETSPEREEAKAIQIDFHWRKIWLGFGFSMAVTLVVGLPLMVALGSAWWLAWTGVAGLFISAIMVAHLAGTGEPLNGAMLALLYFAAVAATYLVGQAFELLPDPLPGLPADDSTYFFVWPLAQIIAGTLGALIGGISSRVRAE